MRVSSRVRVRVRVSVSVSVRLRGRGRGRGGHRVALQVAALPHLRPPHDLARLSGLGLGLGLG